MKKICSICGKEFNADFHYQKFCSKDCYKQSQSIRYWKLQEKRQKYKKFCKLCGEIFYTTNNNKVYCSKNCCMIGNKHKAKYEISKTAWDFYWNIDDSMRELFLLRKEIEKDIKDGVYEV